MRRPRPWRRARAPQHARRLTAPTTSGVGLRCSALLLASVLLSGSGCGYQFVTGGPGPVIGGTGDAAQIQASQANAPRLFVAPVENKSFEPDLERRFTDFLRRNFAAGSGTNVVTDAGRAQFRLRGVIESISLPSLSFTQTTTFESRAVVTMAARVEDVRTNQVVWSDRATDSSEFFITDDLQFNRVLQTRAVEQAGERVAADLAARFLVYLETVRARPDLP